MLKQYSESLLQGLTGLKPGHYIRNATEQKIILGTLKNIRQKDYVFPLTIEGGTPARQMVTTTANWYFLMCGVAVYWEDNLLSLETKDYPRVSVKFKPFVPETPFQTVPEELNAVRTNLCFGREMAFSMKGNTGEFLHFEEYRNLYYSLWQRITFEVEAFPAVANQTARGSVIITGLEFDLTNTPG